MESRELTLKRFSLAEFVKENRAKIDSVTPRNPTISKDDEWRDKSYDDDYRRVIDK